jgi:hypothetical protein
MKKKKMAPFYIVVAALIIAAALVFAWTGYFSGGRAHIVLPGEGSSQGSGEQGTGGQSGDATHVEVGPDNVKNVIATLARPDTYSCAMEIETFYSGGSGTQTVSVRADGGYIRADIKLDGGQTRHVIYGGDKVYIWYDSERAYYEGSAGKLSADAEMRIPTYEDVLKLDTADIAAADYRTSGGYDCIYVSAKDAEDGYTTNYWVDVATGLLVSAETQKNGETVYRMSASDVSSSAPDASAFTLPDGTAVHSVGQ